MSTTMDELYEILSQEANTDPQYRSKWQATKAASLAVLEELEGRCGKSCQELLDVMTSLDAQLWRLHEQAIFRLALRLGLELGRLRCP